MDITSTDLWSVPVEWSATTTHSYMTARGYDVAPFEQRPPDRYIERRWLEGRTGPADGFAKALDASLVVTSAVSLSEALHELKRRAFFFVMEGQRVVGVVTRADIQRPAVSMIVLEFILIIEAGLTRLIESELGSSWREMVPPERLQAAEGRLIERRRRNAELVLEDCLTFEDRLAVVKESEALRDQLGYLSKNKFRQWTERVKRLRDTLAHAGSILDFDPDPEAALSFAEEVRGLAERVLGLVERAESPNAR